MEDAGILKEFGIDAVQLWHIVFNSHQTQCQILCQEMYMKSKAPDKSMHPIFRLSSHLSYKINKELI